MDNQSFELLMGRLDSLAEGQNRIETHLNDRLIEQRELIRQHIEDDKKLADHIIAVDKEVTFAKGVTYAVNGASAFVAWFAGWGK